MTQCCFDVGTTSKARNYVTRLIIARDEIKHVGSISQGRTWLLLYKVECKFACFFSIRII